MYAKLYGDIVKAQKRGKKVKRRVVYYPDKNCKQGIDFDHYCAKCGACGREFDKEN